MVDKTIDAVIPLLLDDFERFILLRDSLRNFTAMGTCWVIVKDAEYSTMLRKVRQDRFVVIPESALVPEFCPEHDSHGWYKQQLIKLAAYEIVKSDFYLVLDADVICVKETRYENLVWNGRASCHRHSKPIIAKWYDWAERVLGVKSAGFTHSVTPNILCRAGVESMASYLANRSGMNWRTYLLRQIPWTEYALYFTYMESQNLFDTYHYDGESLHGNCAWIMPEWEAWDYSKCKDYFTVVQSHLKIPVCDIVERINPDLFWGNHLHLL